MSQSGASAQQKETAVIIDEQRCVGCGLCVKACPMKILAMDDGLCVMTDAGKCLECGTCRHDCPERAIEIVAAAGKASAVFQADSGDEPAAFTTAPILGALQELLAELQPVQTFELDGIDIRALDSFKLEGRPCFSRLYRADKLEKLGVSSVNFYGAMQAEVVSITPGADYDLPSYVMDWDESEDHIFFICDLIPADDPGRNADYLAHQLYAPLEDLYQTYCDIPGLRTSVFHWVRALHSPYIITGTIEKKSQKNVDLIFNCAVDYLKAWLGLYRAAQPRDPASAAMQLVQERRRAVRAQYSENDPGVGALNKFLGDELADIALAIIEP
ncbi:4Fe-4S binding protein [Thermodesulfobacteriota bacterium]